MNLLKANIWQLLRNSTFALPFMLLLPSVFTVLWFSKNPDPTTFQYIKTYLLVTCLPALFTGYLLGVGLQKLKVHYLWVSSKQYRHAILQAGILLITCTVILANIAIATTSHLPLLYLLLPLSLGLMGFLMNTANSLPANIFRSLVCSVLLILLMFETTHTAAQLMVVIGAVYFIWQAFKPPVKHEVISKLAKLSDRASLILWNVKVASFVARFKRSYSKDIAWSICYPQTKLGYMAVYFSLIMLFFMVVESTHLLLGFLLIALVVSCQLPVYQEFTQLKPQLKVIAHRFSNSKTLLKQIMLTFDKVVLLNTGIILLVVVCGNVFMGNSFNQQLLMAISATAVFLSISPLLIVYYSSQFCLSNALLFVVIMALEIAVLGLFYESNAQYHLGFMLAVLLLALVIRIPSQRFLLNQSLERILNNNT